MEPQRDLLNNIQKADGHFNDDIGTLALGASSIIFGLHTIDQVLPLATLCPELA